MVEEEWTERLARDLAEALRGAVKALESVMPDLFAELRAAEENFRRFGRELSPVKPATAKDKQEVS